VPILVFLGLSVLALGPMYVTDVVRQTSDVRQADVRQHHRLMTQPMEREHNNYKRSLLYMTQMSVYFMRYDVM